MVNYKELHVDAPVVYALEKVAGDKLKLLPVLFYVGGRLDHLQLWAGEEGGCGDMTPAQKEPSVSVHQIDCIERTETLTG
jgi:hypothetical protein